MRSKSAGEGWETGGEGGVLLPSILGVFLGRPERSGASGFPDVCVRIRLFRGGDVAALPLPGGKEQSCPVSMHVRVHALWGLL